MHPAYSVIVFTTASGAGFGLLVWLALWGLFGGLATDPQLGLIGLALAIGLAVLGLLSSTLHLGRPLRAWRAFSQWRTSWLSREGVLAVATLVAGFLLGLLWVAAGGGPRVLFGLLALVTVALALATIWCTGMIYQSLPTIRAWHQPLVAPIYVVLGLASGAVLLSLLLAAFGYDIALAARPAVALLGLGLLLKYLYWRSVDGAPRTLTAGAATGLGRFGAVRVLDAPHSRDNFVMREMGYAVARRHAERLRRIAANLAFVVPALLLLLGIYLGAPLPFTTLATLLAAVGLLVERWLFFAEAQHAVTLYYGAETA